ncbi:IS110 family transposase [Streptomyces spinoverrucosus]|uniref:IS110 family transposase n=2 Tax=Streptomyces spinoverrucosus TaxID=284043 RepID=UPI001E60E22D|nr:IS110 family transposase [Streptomyces spinoverrucosus]
MTQPTRTRHHTAEPPEDVVLGVDTHKNTHVAAVTTTTGAMLDTRSFPTTQEGYRQLLAWARAFGQLQRADVECTGSYGAALTRYLHSECITVIEVNQPDKATRRRRGKTDAIDAATAAQAVLSGRATANAKTSDGPVEAIRMFKMAKGFAIKSRSQAINQLKAVLVSADPALRESLSSFRVATDRVTGSMPATHEAPVPLGEVFEVSTHGHRSRVGSVFCRTRPASRPGRVGHHAHRHPRG